MKKLITGENIVKIFGEGKESQTVLDGVSIQIEEGEFVAVMGPSGSGKSTLLFALSGMDSINGGTVFFEETDLTALSDQALSDLRRLKMGFVFQQPTLLKNLNILDNILLPALPGNQKKAPQLIKRAELLMKKTGIGELGKRDITKVSGGQLQRAGICRALMLTPKIIFGDEPTGALNSQASHEIMELLSQINREGTALLLVTHDAKVAARAQRVLFMQDGNMVSELCLLKPGSQGTDKNLQRITEEMKQLGI